MIHYYADLVQGGDEWLAARCGLLTASEMKLIVTPGFKPASNDRERAHLYELLAQRITRYVEPSYIGDDMLRGVEDEIEARRLYAERYAPVQEVGFITNDRWGFTIGYSPDGLVGADGQIECKSRRQRFQVETILDLGHAGAIPADYVVQVQTGLLVTERRWSDFVSYSGGLPMVAYRVHPDERIQEAILEAAEGFDARIRQAHRRYLLALKNLARTIPTERRVETEITI